jgi:hypothetical protein
MNTGVICPCGINNIDTDYDVGFDITEDGEER